MLAQWAVLISTHSRRPPRDLANCMMARRWYTWGAAFAALVALLFTCSCFASLPIFTVDLSQVGVPVKQALDQRIQSIHFKRSPPGAVATQTPTPLQRFGVPTALTTAFDQGKSTLTGLESTARGHASSLLHAGQEQVVQAVNEAYDDVLAALDLDGAKAYGIGSISLLLALYIVSAVLVAVALAASLTHFFTLKSRLDGAGRWLRALIATVAFVMLLLTSMCSAATQLAANYIVGIFDGFAEIRCDYGVEFTALTWLAVGCQLVSAVLLLCAESPSGVPPGRGPSSSGEKTSPSSIRGRTPGA